MTPCIFCSFLRISTLAEKVTHCRLPPHSQSISSLHCAPPLRQAELSRFAVNEMASDLTGSSRFDISGGEAGCSCHTCHIPKSSVVCSRVPGW